MQNEVALLPGTDFYDAQQRDLDFLLSVDDDQMLWNFRKAAGLDTRGAQEMIGWDAPSCKLKGHTTGHYLSALALAYRATGNESLRRKADYMVESLAKCQKKMCTLPGIHDGFLSAYSEEQFDLLEKYTPYPKIWAPYYTFHKILAGLLACEETFSSTTAGDIARGMGLWVYHRLARLPHFQREKMWSLYIAGEFGGMNEVLAELFARTGDERYLDAAHFFDNDRLFQPLLEGRDELDGLHANQHIPQIIGAMRLYEVTGDKKYRIIARNFWDYVISHHIYAPGGTGAKELFRAPDAVATVLTENTMETCASYNMLKLTKMLFEDEIKSSRGVASDKPSKSSQFVRYMDYYERTVTNHILASFDYAPTGGTTYFLPLAPWSKKTYDIDNTCCHGTGMESHFKYGECIFSHSGRRIFVNLLIDSVLDLKNQGIRLKLETKILETSIFMKLLVEQGGRFELWIRTPYWCRGKYHIILNGEQLDETEGRVGFREGYLVLERNFNSGDEIAMEYGSFLRYEPAPDDPEIGVLCWGPYVLAATGTDKHSLCMNFADHPLQKLPREVAFSQEGSGVRWIPLEKVRYENFSVYFSRYISNRTI